MRNLLLLLTTSLFVGGFILSCSDEKTTAPDQKETFMKTFGGSYDDNGYSVQITVDEGFIIAGSTSSYGSIGNNDVWLIKTDLYGNEIWNKTFGGPDSDRGTSVQVTSDSGYIITGITGSFGAGNDDVWLIKTDHNGNELWNKTFGGAGYEFASSVKQTKDGGFIITGATTSFNVNEYPELYLIKTDNNGNELWSKTYSANGYGGGFSVQETTDGGFIVTGVLVLQRSSNDLLLMKTDSNGNEIWTKFFGGTDSDEGYSIQEINDGGYIITGSTRSFGAGYSDVWLIKTDTNGNEEWNKTFGTADHNESGYSLQLTDDGGYIITGTCTDDVLLIKTDAEGNEIWNIIYNNDASDGGYSVQQTNEGGYVIVGSRFENSDHNILLIKTDSEGSVE